MAGGGGGAESTTSYVQQLYEVADVASAREAYMTMFKDALSNLAKTDAYAAMLLNPPPLLSSSSSSALLLPPALVLGSGLSKTATTTLMYTLSNWGLKAAHWARGHDLFRLAEAENTNRKKTFLPPTKDGGGVSVL